MRHLLLSAVLSMFALGCGKEQPVGGPPVTPPGAVGGDTPTAEKPDVTMTAEEWRAESAKDHMGTLNKYAGKVVEVRGDVGLLSIGLENELLLYFESGGETHTDSWVIRDRQAWEKISPGSAVTIRAQLKPRGAKYPGVILADLVRHGANSAPTISATELAKQHQADREKLASQFARRKPVYVEGTVEKIGDMSLTLSGNDGVSVVCGVGLPLWKAIKSVQPGQKIKVLGRYGDDSSRTGGPYLDDCIFKVVQ